MLYLGQGEDERIGPEQQHLLNRLGLERERSEPDTHGLLPISAADLGGEERVARALRWWLTGSLLQRYSPRIHGQRALLDPLANHAERYLEREGDGVLRMVRPPSAGRGEDVGSVPSGAFTAKRARPLWPAVAPGRGRAHASALRRSALLRATPVLSGVPTCRAGVATLGADCYRIQCPSCEARWGIESCGNRGEPMPFLWASGGRLEALQRAPA